MGSVDPEPRGSLALRVHVHKIASNLGLKVVPSWVPLGPEYMLFWLQGPLGMRPQDERLQVWKYLEARGT